MFDVLLEKLLGIGREAWIFLASITGMVALLGALFYVLKGTAGSALGSERTTSMAVIGAVGLIILVLVGFLVIPQMGDLITEVQPEPPF